MQEIKTTTKEKLLGVEPDYLLYSEVSLHWTPVRNVVATPPIIFVLQGGSRGVGCDLWKPRAGGGSGATPPKLKIDVKLPCKML